MITKSLVIANDLAIALKKSRSRVRLLRALICELVEVDHYDIGCPCNGCKAQRKAWKMRPKGKARKRNP